MRPAPWRTTAVIPRGMSEPPLRNPAMTRTSRTVGLVLVALTAFASAALPAGAVRSDDAKTARKPDRFEGAWRQVEQKNGEAQDYQKPPEGVEMINCVTGGRFVWTVVQGGKVLAVAGGKYKADQDKYTEIIEYVQGEGVPASFAGSTFEFTGEVDGDTWHKVGTIQVNGQDYKIDEKWERCK
jgi:hypothetical protein